MKFKFKINEKKSEQPIKSNSPRKHLNFNKTQ